MIFFYDRFLKEIACDKKKNLAHQLHVFKIHYLSSVLERACNRYASLGTAGRMGSGVTWQSSADFTRSPDPSRSLEVRSRERSLALVRLFSLDERCLEARGFPEVVELVPSRDRARSGGLRFVTEDFGLGSTWGEARGDEERRVWDTGRPRTEREFCLL